MSPNKKYRKKPVIIEAIQWDGKNFDAIMSFMNKDHGHKLNYENAEEYSLKTGKIPIRTVEGTINASSGDWIIKGIKGEFYPCKPDIFEQTYELIE